MLETLRQRFAQSVHHRDRSLHPFAVRELHDLQPPVGASFLGRDDVANALHEYLATTTGNRVETRLLQLANNLYRFHPENFGEEIDFAGAEPVNVNGVIALDVAHQIEVPVERDVRIVSALDQDLYTAKRFYFVDLGPDLLEGERIAFAVLGPASECAEAAISHADVRVVDVAVDDVGDCAAGMLLLTHPIGGHSQLEEWSVGVEIEQIRCFAHAAGKKVRVPFGIRPRSTNRR